jgi:hypothetical protein
MPTTVNIPNVGRVRFPDEMSPEQVAAESQSLYDSKIKEISAVKPVEPSALDSIADTVVGLTASVGRGIKAAQAIPEVIALAGVKDAHKPSIKQERRAFERAMSDPRYQDELTAAGDDATAMQRAESLFGPTSKLDTAMTPQTARQEAVVQDVATQQREITALPKSEAQERLSKAQSTKDKWNVWLRDPVELTMSIALESLPPSIAGALIGAPAGPGGVAAGAGAASGLATFSGELLSAAGEQGVDVRDPEALLKWVQNGEAFGKAVDAAFTKSVIVGTIDAATARTAGQFVKPALSQGFQKFATASAKELGVQMAGGAGGEALAQVATGKPLDTFDIAMEAVAEAVSTPGEVLVNLAERNHLPATAEVLRENAETLKVEANVESRESKASPVPEKPDSIAKQLDVTLDPASSKAVTLITPGSPLPPLSEGLERVPVGQHGTADFNPAKTTRDAVLAAAEGKDFDGTLLGMSRPAKPEPVGNTVVQTTKDGVPVLDEVVPPTPEAIATATAAHKAAVPGGETKVVPAETVLTERQGEFPSRVIRRSDYKTESEWAEAVAATERWANDPNQFSSKASPSLHEPWTKAILQVVPLGNGFAVEYAGQRVGYGKTEAAAISAAERTHAEFRGKPLQLSPATESTATTVPRTGSPSLEEIGDRPGETISTESSNAPPTPPPGRPAETTAPDGTLPAPTGDVAGRPAPVAGEVGVAEVAKRFSIKEENGLIYVADATQPMVQYGNSLKDTPANRTRLGKLASDFNTGVRPIPKLGYTPKPKAAPVEKATAKMQEQVSEVAKTEGARPAKEIKSELVQRLEEALEKAPEQAALNEQQLQALKQSPRKVGYKDMPGYEGRGTEQEMITSVRWAEKENTRIHSEWVSTVKATGVEQVTIEIPGDGTFTVWNTKEALTELLDRAKKLSTQSTAPDKTAYTKPKPTGNFDADVWVESSEPTHDVTVRVGVGKESAEVVRKGREIKIKGHDDKKLFLTSEGTEFRITEPRTGLSVGTGKTISKAIEDAQSKLAKAGFEKALADGLKQNGERPAPKPLNPQPQSLGGMNPADVGELRKAQLAQLTDSVQAMADSGKASVEKAFGLGESLAGVKESITGALDGLRAAGMVLKRVLEGKPVVTDWRRMLGDRHLALSESALNARKWMKQVLKAIPDPKVREAISNWVDTGGDDALLAKAAAETKERYRAGYEMARKLTPEQLTVAQNLRNYFESRLQEAIDAGILEDGIENYIHRIYEAESDWKKGVVAELRSGLFTGRPGLAKQRVFEYDFEAEKAGKRPIKDFAKRVVAYDLALNKAIADRQAVKAMMEITMPDGRPMIDVGGGGKVIENAAGETDATLINRTQKRISEDETENRGDFKAYDHPALRKWKWAANDAAGKPIFVQGDVLVHPEALKQVEVLFDRSRVRKNPVGNVALKFSSTIKQTMLDLSLFHQVQIGIHGMEHKTFKPVTEIDFTNPDVRGLIKGGATVGETSGRELFSEGLAGSSLTRHVPWLGQRVEAYQDYLFGDYIPRLKMAMGLHALERNRSRFPKLSPEQLYQMTADQMNAAFGELNYEMLGRSKTMQDALRLSLLAPDFLEARSRFVAQAFTKLGKEQRVALLLGAGLMFVTARILNKLLNDEYRWEPKNWFSVVYKGRSYGLRTVQGDLIHAVTDPGKFTNHRLNPVYGKPVLEFVTGRDYFGRERDLADKARDMAATPIPISLRGLFSGQELTLLESFLNSIGAVVKRDSPSSKMAELAKEWKEENKIKSLPGDFVYDADKDEFRDIKLAAERGDESAVRSEVAKAITGGLTKRQIIQHFTISERHQFSGSSRNEQKFVASLTADEKKIYEDARAERKRMKDLVLRASR